SSLNAVRLHMQVRQLAAEHDDGALAPVVSRVRELERVGARDPQLAILVAREAQPGKGHGVVEELQLVAPAGGAPGVDRALARAQAVHPEERPGGDEDYGGALPHAGADYRV